MAAAARSTDMAANFIVCRQDIWVGFRGARDFQTRLAAPDSVSARLRAPAQETGAHSIAQLLRRLDRARWDSLRLHRGGRRGLRSFLPGMTRLKPRDLFAGQSLASASTISAAEPSSLMRRSWVSTAW